MQNLNTRPATRKVGQSTEIVKLLRIQASDTHVVEFDNVDTRFNDCNNWQVMAGGKRVLFSNRMYERFSDVKSGIVATINVCENSGSVTDKAMLEGAKVMMQVLDGYPSFAALAAHPKRITGYRSHLRWRRRSGQRECGRINEPGYEGDSTARRRPESDDGWEVSDTADPG